ncbi:MAG: hydroxymethylglutaryl-CoA lyase [Bdellovibrionales bacterium]|nr:hydroxymethylglutaryl-CoA lyase [Bdellovibrionales bacterium]
MKEKIEVFEVGPRDGLQNERLILSTSDKVALIEELAAAGLNKIEAGAFVRPDRVPQMADSEQLHLELKKRSFGKDAYFLVPNLKGLERAMSAGISHIAVFTAVSESFNRKNIGMTVQESLALIRQIVDTAAQEGIRVRGYVSTVFGCPFEGRVSANKAIPVIEQLLSLELEQVSIGDTIGVASAKGVEEVIRPVLTSSDASRIAVHFHDTRGTALANALRSFELGVRTFDSSIGGLGGCPFAPGASGNLATEDLVYFFKEMDVETGVDYRALCETSLKLADRMKGRILSSRALQAYLANCQKNSVWDS